MTLLNVWINCPDRGVAEAIAAELVGRRLAAAANIHPEIDSLYRWRGEVVRARETPLLVKTRAELFEAVAAAARALHPYETPAIVAVAVARADDDYADWLRAETQ